VNNVKAQTEVTIKIGKTKDALGTVVAKAPLEVGQAVNMIGGISEREDILIVRDGAFYVINDAAMRSGGLNVILRNGDQVSLLGPGNNLKSFRGQHSSVVVGLDALKKLSTTEQK
jgi:hypothetical protein